MRAHPVLATRGESTLSVYVSDSGILSADPIGVADRWVGLSERISLGVDSTSGRIVDLDSWASIVSTPIAEMPFTIEPHEADLLVDVAAIQRGAIQAISAGEEYRDTSGSFVWTDPGANLPCRWFSISDTISVGLNADLEIRCAIFALPRRS